MSVTTDKPVFIENRSSGGGGGPAVGSVTGPLSSLSPAVVAVLLLDLVPSSMLSSSSHSSQR